MIKLENYEIVGWEHAIRGMRNPKNSWNRSDSRDCRTQRDTCSDCIYLDENNHECPGVKYYTCESNMCGFVGPNDHELMMTLAKGGPVHAKYRRMITVYVDITAPLYWWKEFDTYKVGTVANSCSTMHKITDKEFVLGDFSIEHLVGIYDKDGEVTDLLLDVSPLNDNSNCYSPCGIFNHTVKMLNICRDKYNKTKTKPMKDESKRKELLKLYFDQMIQLLPSSYNQKRTVMLNYEVLTNIYRWRRNHKLDEWHVFCDWIESLPYSEIITGETVKEGKDDE